MTNFKVGDRVMVANIEDEGVIQAVKNDHYQVRWPNYLYSNYHWYPAFQVRLAEETLEDFINNYPNVIDVMKQKRKKLRKLYRQLEAEIPDRCLQERLSRITDQL